MAEDVATILLNAVTRFRENEARVQDFVNDNSEGFYRTNLVPQKKVETLPHFMARIAERYLTMKMQGLWKPGTRYYYNDLVRSPEDGSYWIVGVNHVSAATWAEEVSSGAIGLYGNRVDVSQEENYRVTWLLETAVPSGGILTIPAFYRPGKHVLVFAANGKVLYPVQPDLFNTTVPDYEEIFVPDEVLSNKVRMLKPLQKDAVMDVLVLQSTLIKYIAEITELFAQATARMNELLATAQGFVDAAAEEAGKAAASAEEAYNYAIDAEAAYNSHYVAVGEGNARDSWIVEYPKAPGDVIHLPVMYLPGRDVLLLWYNGSICVPMKEGITDPKRFQYEEIPPDEGEEGSNLVRIHFRIYEGDQLDAMALAGGLTRHLELIEAARGAAEAAREGAETAEGEAEAARDAALGFATGAEQARDFAEGYRDEAEDFRDAAETFRDGAAEAAANALGEAKLYADEQIEARLFGTLRYRGDFIGFYDSAPGELEDPEEGDVAWKRAGDERSAWDGEGWQTEADPPLEIFDLWANLRDGHGYYWFADEWNLIDFNADLSLKEDKSSKTSALTLDPLAASDVKYPSEKGVALAVAAGTAGKEDSVNKTQTVNTDVSAASAVKYPSEKAVAALLALFVPEAPDLSGYQTRLEGTEGAVVAYGADGTVTELAVDDEPAEDSGNLIRSGAVAALAAALTEAIGAVREEAVAAALEAVAELDFLILPVTFPNSLLQAYAYSSIPEGYCFAEIVYAETDGTEATLTMSRTYGSESMELPLEKTDVTGYDGGGVTFQVAVTGGQKADFQLRLTRS